jgi:hypothetical protein
MKDFYEMIPNYYDYDYWFAKVKYAYWLLRYVPEHLRDERMCKYPLNKNGFYLKYVPKSIKTPKLCIKALKNNKGCIPFIPKHFYITDKIGGLGRFKTEVIRAIKFIDIPHEIIFIFDGQAGNYEKTMERIYKKSISVYENKLDYKNAVKELSVMLNGGNYEK